MCQRIHGFLSFLSQEKIDFFRFSIETRTNVSSRAPPNFYVRSRLRCAAKRNGDGSKHVILACSPRRNAICTKALAAFGGSARSHREAGREMFADCEVLAGPSEIAIYKDTIQKWDPPYGNVPVTDSDRDRILKNIRNAFRYQRFEIHEI